MQSNWVQKKKKKKKLQFTDGVYCEWNIVSAFVKLSFEILSFVVCR